MFSALGGKESSLQQTLPYPEGAGGGLCGAGRGSVSPALCVCCRPRSATSLYLEATPFVQLGCRPDAVSVYTITANENPFPFCTASRCLCIVGIFCVACVLDSIFPSGDIYLGGKTNLPRLLRADISVSP